MAYEFVEDGPAALSWDEYAPIVDKEWQRLLAKEETGERDFHEFLERHPCMIPGHDAFTGAAGWDNPASSVNGCVISEPLLPGISNRFPDFMWTPTDSQTQWVVLVEIEDPKKPWFTQKGQQSAMLTQAVDQTAQWRAYFKKAANLLQFRSLYGIPDSRPIEFIFCLVYGRRRQVSARAAMERRNSLQNGLGDMKWMTYDRLRANEGARDFPCVKVSTDEKFTAVSFPATAKLDLWSIDRWSRIAGKSDAVLTSPHFTHARRNFLAGRLNYWDELLATGLSISPLDHSKGE